MNNVVVVNVDINVDILKSQTKIMLMMFIMCSASINVTRPWKINHVGTTSEMHFVASYHRYTHTLSKYSNNITRGDQICFYTRLFLDHAKH